MNSLMPVIIKCPYPECGRYMLIESSQANGDITCLICKQKFRTAAEAPKEAQADSTTDRLGKADSAETGSINMVACPGCGSSYGVPQGISGSKMTHCPKCGHEL